MVRRLALRAFAASVAVLAFSPGLPAATAHADPVMVYPGMEILQENRLCTLGYVDPGQKIAYTAGHCRSGPGPSPTNRNVIGHLATFRDNTPSGAAVTTDQQVADYESIVLDANVPANNILPGGRALQSIPGWVPHPGEPVCHFGVVTGESCGTVESVNNGWFTMGHGAISHQGRLRRTGLHGRRAAPRGSSGSSTASGGISRPRCRGSPPPSRSARTSASAVMSAQTHADVLSRSASAKTGIDGAAARNCSSPESGVSPATWPLTCQYHLSRYRLSSSGFAASSDLAGLGRAADASAAPSRRHPPP